MTIQIRTTQIPTIQVFKKIKNTYLNVINIYKPLFSFLNNLKYSLRYFKTIRNNYVFYFIEAISQKVFIFLQKEKNGLYILI